MAVIIPDIVIAVDEVPAIDIIDQTVVIVVQAIAGDLARICPELILQINMCQVYTRINHGDCNCGGAIRSTPCAFDVHFCQSPLLAVKRIVNRELVYSEGRRQLAGGWRIAQMRKTCGVGNVIWFSEYHIRIRRQLCHNRIYIGGRLQLYFVYSCQIACNTTPILNLICLFRSKK